MRVNCFECTLRACGSFKTVSQNELAFINDMKRISARSWRAGR